jgi:hypothetical protein
MNEKIRVLGACLWRCRFNVPIKLNQISVYFAGMAKLSFELEVCRIPNLNVVGIRRKRLKGDAWCYKKVCEEVLRLAAVSQK